MAYAVVLDANVLYPFSLRDTILRLAEQELFDIAWSERILDEVTRNLVKDGYASEEQAARLTQHMRAAFPDAEQDLDAIAALEPQLHTDEKDRHVLAAAILASAEGILTFNTKDFPAEALEPFGKQTHEPDEFLCTTYEMYPDITAQTVVEQAAALRRPPRDVADVLDMLHLGGVPGFANAIRRHLGIPERTEAEILAAREPKIEPTNGSRARS